MVFATAFFNQERRFNMSCECFGIYMHINEIKRLIDLSKKRFKAEKFGEFVRRMQRCYRGQAHFTFEWLPRWIRPKLKSVREIASKFNKKRNTEFYDRNPYLYIEDMHWRESRICRTLLDACKFSCEDKIMVPQEAISMFEITKCFFKEYDVIPSDQHSSSVDQ